MENEHESQAGNAEAKLVEFKLKRLVLASSSPRRAEILRSVGWEFESLPVDIDETRRMHEPAVDYVRRLALEKAQAAAGLSTESVVMGADTTVVVDGNVLGKPNDQDEARSMLGLLNGRWHEVLTGVALLYGDKLSLNVVGHETTRVLFSVMSEVEIDWYVATGEPMGKAGGYAIQGRAALFIEKIEGDYWNVVGLPVRLAYRMVREL